MKTFFTILLAGLFIISCSDSTPEPSNSATGSISYKVNGQLVVYDNANFSSGEYAGLAKQLRGTAIPATRYVVNAQKGSSNLLQSGIITDSLTVGTFRYDSVSVATGAAFLANNVLYNGAASTVFYNGDFLEFKITSHTGGRVSGTFTGRMSPLAGALSYATKGTTVITEGVINNVPVIY